MGSGVMDWIWLGALSLLWGALLLPRKQDSGDRTSKNLELMSHMQETRTRPGRYVMMPRQDERFIGAQGRVKSRVRQRRRQVLSVLGESIAFSALIGAFPPLRAMWTVTFVLVGFFVVYLGMLLRLRLRSKRRTIELPEEDLAVVRRRVEVQDQAERRVATS